MELLPDHVSMEEAYNKVVLDNPKYNKINLMVPYKKRELIFAEACHIGSLFPFNNNEHLLRNIAAMYDRLLNLFLDLHPEVKIQVNNLDSLPRT